MRFLSSQGSTSLTNDAAQKSQVLPWINTVSNQVEKYLNREIHTESRTEYFDIKYGTVQLWPAAPPISSVTSLYADSTGLWDGDESELDDYYIGADSYSVNLDYPENYTANKALRLIYTGGLAYSGVQSVFAVTGVSGTWAVDKFAVGGDSNSVGIVKAASSTSITLEVLYGYFEDGETLTEYDSESSQGSSDGTATISSVTRRALCEAYPEITSATEMQIRYFWKHKHDYEVNGINESGQTTRAQNRQRILNLQPEVVALLDPYRILHVY